MLTAGLPASIHALWFGPVKEFYGRVWFAPENSLARARIDTAVESGFGELLRRIARASAQSPPLPASHADAQLLAELDSWMVPVAWGSAGGDAYSHVALVVLLDQFSRHVFRRDSTLPPAEQQARAAAQAACDARALVAARRLLDAGDAHDSAAASAAAAAAAAAASAASASPAVAAGTTADDRGGSARAAWCGVGWARCLSPAQAVFALMPLRHTPTPRRLREVLARTEALSGREAQGQELLQRFRATTSRKLEHLPSAASADGSGGSSGGGGGGGGGSSDGGGATGGDAAAAAAPPPARWVQHVRPTRVPA